MSPAKTIIEAIPNHPACKRSSGRTSRMIQRALQLSEEGRAVYIVAVSASHCKRLENRLPCDSRVKVININFTPSFDWESMKLDKAWPNCICLVDHHLIESRFSKMFEELHRYDTPLPKKATKP